MRKQKIIFNCWQLDSKEQGKGTFLSGDRFISSRKLHGETIVPSFLPAVGRNKRCWRKKDSPSGKKDGWFATSARRRSGSSWRTGNEVFKWNLLFNLMIVPLYLCRNPSWDYSARRGKKRRGWRSSLQRKSLMRRLLSTSQITHNKERAWYRQMLVTTYVANFRYESSFLKIEFVFLEPWPWIT